MSEQVDVATVASATDAGIGDLLLKPIDVSYLRVRLGVAERVQVLISQLDEQTNAVRFHASHDSLTGLWNRELLLNLLFSVTDRVQRMRTQLCLLLFYLDHISDINIDYGYEAGEQRTVPLVVLREAERALGEAKRSGRKHYSGVPQRWPKPTGDGQLAPD